MSKPHRVCLVDGYVRALGYADSEPVSRRVLAVVSCSIRIPGHGLAGRWGELCHISAQGSHRHAADLLAEQDRLNLALAEQTEHLGPGHPEHAAVRARVKQLESSGTRASSPGPAGLRRSARC